MRWRMFVNLAMRMETDQMGCTVEVPDRPQRIISLVPSQSEFIWDIGAGPQLAGITRFCIHPDEMYRSVKRVGGTKDPDPERIASLKPDLIIGNKEENEAGSIARLREKYPVWMSDIVHPGDAFDMMLRLGRITGHPAASRRIVEEARNGLEDSREIFPPLRTLYFIWKDPWMCSAGNTFTGSLLRHTGLINCIESYERYPVLDDEAILSLDPQLCLLSSEPYPFREKHVSMIRDLLPQARVLLVDGEMFSWYGSRMLRMPAYFSELRKKLDQLF